MTVSKSDWTRQKFEALFAPTPLRGSEQVVEVLRSLEARMGSPESAAIWCAKDPRLPEGGVRFCLRSAPSDQASRLSAALDGERESMSPELVATLERLYAAMDGLSIWWASAGERVETLDPEPLISPVEGLRPFGSYVLIGFLGRGDLSVDEEGSISVRGWDEAQSRVELAPSLEAFLEGLARDAGWIAAVH